MSTHNIRFHQEIRKVLCGYPLLSVAMLEMWLSDLAFPQFCKSDTWRYEYLHMEIWISPSSSRSPLDFEITRVDYSLKRELSRTFE